MRPIIMSQTFNSSYQPVIDLAQLGWHELVGKDATIGYTWKYAGTEPFTDTVWAAGRNPSGYPLLSPATGTYTNGMEALLVYGPLDMSDYGQAVFTMTYWLDVAPGDSIGVAVSTDGSNFMAVNNESISDPTLATTRTVTLNLSPYIVRQPAVWIAVYLKSNTDSQLGRGMFVHDVVVRGVPLSKSYMPLVMNGYPPATNTPTPTPTPIWTPTPTPGTYRYLYTFTSETPATIPTSTAGAGIGQRVAGTNCTYYQALVGDVWQSETCVYAVAARRQRRGRRRAAAKQHQPVYGHQLRIQCRCLCVQRAAGRPLWPGLRCLVWHLPGSAVIRRWTRL